MRVTKCSDNFRFSRLNRYITVSKKHFCAKLYTIDSIYVLTPRKSHRKSSFTNHVVMAHSSHHLFFWRANGTFSMLWDLKVGGIVASNVFVASVESISFRRDCFFGQVCVIELPFSNQVARNLDIIFFEMNTIRIYWPKNWSGFSDC